MTILKPGCTWNLGIDQDTVQFKTEQELDMYLEQVPYKFINSKDTAIFSMDLKAPVLEKLDNIERELSGYELKPLHRGSKNNDYYHDPEETEEIEYYRDIPKSIGVTRFLTAYGNWKDIAKGISPEFIIENWRSHKKKEYMDSGMAIAAALQLIQEQEESWPELTEYGTEVHNIIDHTFKGTEWKKPTNCKLTDTQIADVKHKTQQLIELLKKKHGANAEFRTEFAIKSKELDPELQAIVGDKYTSINGKIDLLVIDDYGQAHIYDFKVSRKGVGNWNETNDEIIPTRKYENGILLTEGEWSSSKKLTAANQLAFYNAILDQHGIKVKTANIIPIKLNFGYSSEYKIDSLRGIDFPTEDRIIFNVPGTTAGRIISNIKEHLLPGSNYTTSEEMQHVFKIWNQYLPAISITSSITVQRKTREFDRIKENEEYQILKPGDPKYEEGYRFAFRKVGLGNKTEYFETEEKLDEAILKYLKDLQDKKAQEVLDLGNLIDEAIKEGKELDHFIGNIPEQHRPFVKDQFKRYVKDEGWSLWNNPALISSGIFIFERGGLIEIISLTNTSLHNQYNLDFGNTILGKNVRNKAVGSKNILEATAANIEIIKALIYVGENQHKFSGKKIVQIKALNPWYGQVDDTVLNSTLVENYQKLRMHNPDVHAKSIGTSLFLSDGKSLQELLKSKMESLDPEVIDFSESYDLMEVHERRKWVSKAMSSMESKYPELLKEYQNNEIFESYYLLTRMLRELDGIMMNQERDKQGIGEGTIFTGTEINSPQYSPSKNIKAFATLLDRYEAEVSNMVNEMGFKMWNALQAHYKVAGNGAQAFDTWFERNPDGSISKNLRLVDPSDSGVIGKEALDIFLSTMYKLRYPNATEIDIRNAKTDKTYYELPLTEAAFSRQMKNLGIRQAIKNKWDEHSELMYGVFAGTKTEDVEKFERENKSVYNKFRLTGKQRRDLIEDTPTGFFETHIERVFNKALVEYCRERISADYVPKFKAMQMEVRRSKEYAGNDLTNVEQALNKMINSKFYGKPIMKEGLRPYYKYLSAIKSGFSTLNLGLNARSFLRETLTGMYIGTTRSMAHHLDGLSADNYATAISYIVKDLKDNPSGIALIQQLNADYRMANYSLSNIANQRRLNWLNIKNWGKDTMFIGCSAPDYQHRNAILIAKMMGDGCWEAHSLDQDGKLSYDFAKDKRYAIYNSGNRTHPEYAAQEALYLKNLEEFNKQGYKKPDGSSLVKGDPLPRAYTSREGQSIKNYADILYGHYDDASKSLINDTFIGAFFMQYKTFVTSKLEQWFMKGDVYNIEFLKQQYDPVTGEKLYEVYKFPNDDTTGMPERIIYRESELASLSEEERNAAKPYFEWEGQPMEGLFYSSWRFVKALVSMDQKKLEEIWNDPHEKAQLILAFNDLILMALLNLIITGIFAAALGSDDYDSVWSDAKKAGPLASMSYSVLVGMTEDGPVHKIIGRMISDVNPPIITSMQKLGKSCWGVITGDSSLAYALTRNIGMLSDLQGLVQSFDED